MRRVKNLFFVMPVAALLVIAACKKGDDSQSTHGAPLVSKIIWRDNSFSGNDWDTATVNYNADGTVHQIRNSLDSGAITFYYSSGLIRRVNGVSGSWETVIDSIIIGANGLPEARYELLNYYSLDNSVQLYTYNSSEELARTIIYYPNRPAYRADTITHLWSNGDMVGQSSTSGDRDFTYTYDTQRPCQPGDPLYMLHMTETGSTAFPNAHLCISANKSTEPANYSYEYDASNRIKQYIIAQGQKTDTSYFNYDQ